MAALVDSNILVYRFDSRFPLKQAQDAELLTMAETHRAAPYGR